MTNYLYILLLKNESAYKIGITKNLAARVSSIERSFGTLNKSSSYVYSCKNRALIEKIESGIHAILSKYPYFHEGEIRNGSSEWFCGSTFNIAIKTIEIFINADIGLSTPTFLLDVLSRPVDFNSQLDYYKNQELFFNSHDACIKYIDSIIINSKPKISVSKSNGFFIIHNLIIPDYSISAPIEYNWFKFEQNNLFLDIRTMNRWKISRVHKEIFNLVFLKYFAPESLGAINSIFDENGLLISLNLIKIKDI